MVMKPAMLSIVAGCLFVIFVGQCSAECILPPKDNPLMVATLECSKEYGKNHLCVLQCLLLRTGLVTKEGTIDLEKGLEMWETIEEGDLKDGFRLMGFKCMKDMSIKFEIRDDCKGFLKIAKCGLKYLKQRCPEFTHIAEF